MVNSVRSDDSNADEPNDEPPASLTPANTRLRWYPRFPSVLLFFVLCKRPRTFSNALFEAGNYIRNDEPTLFLITRTQSQGIRLADQANLSQRARSLRACTNLISDSGTRVFPEQSILFRTVCPWVSDIMLFNIAAHDLGQKILMGRSMLAPSSDFLTLSQMLGQQI